MNKVYNHLFHCFHLQLTQLHYIFLAIFQQPHHIVIVLILYYQAFPSTHQFLSSSFRQTSLQHFPALLVSYLQILILQIQYLDLLVVCFLHHLVCKYSNLNCSCIELHLYNFLCLFHRLPKML